MDKSQMEYRYIGKTGLRVSAISFGNMDPSSNTEIIKRCLEVGINFFDTAESYSEGLCEKALGQGLKEAGAKREHIVVSTKLFSAGPGKINKGYLSRKHIIEGMRNSLARLQLDYVDFIFCHRPDLYAPLEETVRAMTWLIKKGYALYWGTSEWPATMIVEAIHICKKFGLPPPVVEQVEYSMIERTRFENEYRRLFEEYGIGTTTWSPLAGGILTGKYNSGETPADGRYNKIDHPIIKAFWVKKMGKNPEQTQEKLTKLGEYAKELGYTQAQLALAWVLASGDVSTCMMGFSKLEQFESNIKALELYRKWTPEIEARCEDIINNMPEPELDWRKYQPRENRRKQILMKIRK